MSRALIAAALAAVATIAGSAIAAEPRPQAGIATRGEPAFPNGFDHLPYVNPKAPKGGDVRLAAIGTYDSLNPFIIKGLPAAGVGYLFDTLMASSQDEPSSAYGLVAESVTVPDDRSWVVFTLRPEAKFSDGSRITVDDVLFSFETLTTKGAPQYRFYYAGVATAEALDDRRVKFTFKPGSNRELPVILGQLPILSKAYFAKVPFDQTTLTPPLGSGPYKIAGMEPGRSIIFRRDPSYWGKDVPVNRGRYNFDTVRFDYYRDSTIVLEALKAGQYDYRLENSAKRWATGYTGPAVEQGQLVKLTLPDNTPAGMQAYVFNTRRPIFQDPKLRQALAYAMDFEWSNKTLFFDAYRRTRSYFDNSELAATGLPGADELKILEPLRDKVPAEVFSQRYDPPKTDGSGEIRANLREAFRLLKEAGWEVAKDTRLMTNLKTGQPLRFEILLVQEDFVRVVEPFAQNLKRLGIEASLRVVDPSQYQRRTDDFDFDVIIGGFAQSISPGNELRNYWGCAAAKEQGSQNTVGICDPAIDQLIEGVIAADTREDLINHTRALDRVLQWHHFVIPQWHNTTYRIARWDIFGTPPEPPRYGIDFDSWWIDPAKLAKATLRKAGS